MQFLSQILKMYGLKDWEIKNEHYKLKNGKSVNFQKFGLDWAPSKNAKFGILILNVFNIKWVKITLLCWWKSIKQHGFQILFQSDQF